MLTIYHDDVEMQNGNIGGDGSSKIISHAVQLDKVEEVGWLVP